MEIRENVLLKEHTYYRIGGPARYFIEAKSGKEVKEGLSFAKDKNLSVFVLGGGTNVLFADDGFDGLVLKLSADNRRIKTRTVADGRKEMAVWGGVQLSKVVKVALDNNLAGLEWAAGIPGTVGGSVRGNAGAFGGSMADVVRKVKVLESGIKNQESGIKEYKEAELSRDQMEFKYRSSRIKKEGGVILEVILRLEKGSREQAKRAKEEARDHIEYRKENQPYKKPSCGSVFKGVVLKRNNLTETLREFDKKGKLVFKNLEDKKIKIPAGWLIEKAGLKGETIGKGQISEKHANFIVNLGEAKAQDVYGLIQLARRKVKDKFGIELETEVEIVG